MLPGASLRAYVSPSSKQNPPLVEPPAASTRPVSPSVPQEAALSPPGIKDPPADEAAKYWDVLPLPLAGMFTGWTGRPETIKGGKETDADAYKGGYQWESHLGSEASAEEEE